MLKSVVNNGLQLPWQLFPTKPIEGHIMCFCVGQKLCTDSSYSYILDYLVETVLCSRHLTVYYALIHEARTKPSATVPDSLPPCQENLHSVIYNRALSPCLSIQNSAPQGVMCVPEEHVIAHFIFTHPALLLLMLFDLVLSQFMACYHLSRYVQYSLPFHAVSKDARGVWVPPE